MSSWLAMKVAAHLAVVWALSIQPAPPQETLVQKLLRIAGLTAAPSQMRGSVDDGEPGNIFLANLDLHTTKALTTDGGYRSPVFSGDGQIYALKSGTIVRVPREGGRAVAVQNASGAGKLVGFGRDSGDEVVVLLDGPQAGSPLGVMSLKNGTLTPLPYDSASDEQRRMVAQVRAQDRAYGDTIVYPKTETKRGISRNVEWTDVYVKRGSGVPQNISLCDGVNCAQPALSPDGRSVAYVKMER